MTVQDASQIADENDQNLYIFVRVRNGDFVGIDFEKVTIDNGYAVKENRMKNGMYIRIKDIIEQAKYDSSWQSSNIYGELNLLSEYEEFKDMKRKLLDTDEGRKFIEFGLSNYGIDYSEEIKESLDFISRYKYSGKNTNRKNNTDKNNKDLEQINDNKEKERSNDIKNPSDISVHVNPEEEKNVNRNVIRTVFENMLPDVDSVVYTLKLLHNEKEERAFYVGRSSIPKQRISQHLRKDGDFSDSNGYTVTGIKFVDDEHKISEREKYLEMKQAVSCPVFGGKW